MSLNDCLANLGFLDDDADEIRQIAQDAGDEIAGVQRYIAALEADREDLRQQLIDKGYDVADPKAAVAEAAISDMLGISALRELVDADAPTQEQMDAAKAAIADDPDVKAALESIGRLREDDTFESLLEMDIDELEAALEESEQRGVTLQQQEQEAASLEMTTSEAEQAELDRVSVRKPWAANWVAPEDQGELQAGMLDSTESAEAFEGWRNKVVRQRLATDNYPGIVISEELSDEQNYRNALDFFKSNLLKLYQAVPEEQRAITRQWYRGANRVARTFAQRYGVTSAQASGVLAVLSPSADWYMNVSNAERLFDIWANHQNTTWSSEMSMLADRIYAKESMAQDRARIEGKTLAEVVALDEPDLQAMWVRAYDEAHNDRKHRIVMPDGTFGDWVRNTPTAKNPLGRPAIITAQSIANISKAVQLIQAEPSAARLSELLGEAHKVRSFYNNIVAPDSPGLDVTIDTHAVGAALLRAVGNKDRVVADNFGAPSQSLLGYKGMYNMYAQAYREVADELGVLPRELQSVTWEAIRTSFPASWKATGKPQIDAIWLEYENGGISLEEAQDRIFDLAPVHPGRASGGSSIGELGQAGYTSYEGALFREGATGRTVGPGGRGDVAAGASTARADGGRDLDSEAEAGISFEQRGEGVENDLLRPPGESMMMGDETVLVDEPDLLVTQSDYVTDSGRMLRYVRKENGEPIGALQLRTHGKRSKKATIANVYTVESRRREKVAVGLLRRARQDFDVKHSTDLTNDGRAFAEADVEATRRAVRRGRIRRGTSFEQRGEEGEQVPMRGFRSQMLDFLKDKLPGKGSGKQMREAVETFVKKGNFKKEELEWSGLLEWLKGMDNQKLTNKDVIEFLTANALDVRELERGGIDPDKVLDDPEWWDRFIDYSHDVVLDRYTFTTIGQLNDEYQERFLNDYAPGHNIDEEMEYQWESIAEDAGLDDDGNFDQAAYDEAYAEFMADPANRGQAVESLLESVTGYSNLDEAHIGYDDRGRFLTNPYGRDPAPEIRDDENELNDIAREELEYSGELMADFEEDMREQGYFRKEDIADLPSAVKWHQFTTEGGYDYREMQILLPKVDGTFEYEAHWEESNVVAHVRYKSLAPGKDHGRMLFIEEIQSDWHQQGLKQGYERKLTDAEERRLEEIDKEVSLVRNQINELYNARADAEDALALNVSDRRVAIRERKKKEAVEAGRPANHWGLETVVDYDGQEWVDWLGVQIPAEEAYQKLETDLLPRRGTTLDRLQRNVAQKIALEEAESDLQYQLLKQQRDRLHKDYLEKVAKQDDLEQERDNLWQLDAVPDAPFKTSWPVLVFKRMLKEAVDTGKNHIGWTTGKMQANRYGQAADIDRIVYRRNEDGLYDISVFRRAQFSVDPARRFPYLERKGLTDVDLQQLVGVGISQQMEAGEGAILTDDDGNENLELNGVDLNIGGEGMKKFYDVRLRNEVKKLIKKYGGTVEQVEVRLDEGETVWSVEITQEMREAVNNNKLTLFQDKAKLGQVTFGDEGGTVVELFEKADLSTMLHETGHVFVRMLEKVALQDDAPKRIKDNYQAMLDYVGAKTAADIDPRISGDAAVEKQELLARSFEAYLKEGKAPTAQLRSAFAAFREWLTLVYTRLRNLGTPISPEIAGVFDRMLATEQELAMHREMNAVGADANPSISKLMSASEQARYKAIQQEAEDLDRQEADRIKREIDARKLEDWWVSETESVEAEVRAELMAMPAYKMWEEITAGPREGRINKQPLMEMGIEQKDFNAMPKNKGRRVYTTKGGLDPEVVAARYGYASGLEMALELVDLVDPAAFIPAEAQRRMKERHGDPNFDGTEDQLTQETLYHEVRRKAIEAELNALAKASGQQPVGRALARAMVDQIFDTTPVGDLLQPMRYQAASVRYAREAERLAAGGDAMGAFEAKRRHLLNHEMFRRALKAKADTEKMTTNMRKLQKRKIDPKRVAPEYVGQIKSLLRAYMLEGSLKAHRAQRENLKAVADGVLRFVEESNAKGVANQVVIPGDLLEMLQRGEQGQESTFAMKVTHWREMTMTELKALNDMVDSMLAMGRSQSAAERARIREANDALAENINLKTRRRKSGKFKAPPTKQEMDKLEAQRGMLAFHRKLEFMLRELDGFEENGPMWRAVFLPLVNAQNHRNQLVQQMLKQFDEVWGILPRSVRSKMASSKSRLMVPGMKTEGGFTHEQRIMIALNAGSESSRQALLSDENIKQMFDGDGVMKKNEDSNWNEATLQSVLDQLSTDDWKVVQGILDIVNQYWNDQPEIRNEKGQIVQVARDGIATLERRATGVVPTKVKPLRISGKNGDIPGGYFPLKYSGYDSATVTREIENDSAKKMMSGGFARAHTSHNFTKERVGSGGRPLRLDMGVLMQHVDEVTQDIAFREAVQKADQIINDPVVAKAIRDGLGQQYLNNMRKILVSTANGGTVAGQNWGDRIFRHARLNVTTAVMALNLRSILTQPFGLTQSVARLGAWPMLKGTFWWYMNPLSWRSKMHEVYSMSPFMAERARAMTRELDDIENSVQMPNVWRKFQAVMFQPMVWTDVLGVAMPTWKAAYEQAMAGKVRGVNGEQASIDFADAVVRQSQGTGGALNQALIEQDGELWKAISMFGSYFNVTANMQMEAFAKVGQADGAAAKAAAIPGLVWQTIWLQLLPALITSYIIEEGWDEEDEDRFNDSDFWALQQLVTYVTGQVFILRDIVGMVTTPFGFQLSPVESVGSGIGNLLKDMVEVSKDAIQGNEVEIGASSMKNAIRLMSYYKGIPATNQIIRTTEYLYKLDQGTLDNPPTSEWHAAKQLLFTGDKK